MLGGLNVLLYNCIHGLRHLLEHDLPKRDYQQNDANRTTPIAHNYCVNGRLREEEDDEDQEREKQTDDGDVDGNEHDNVPSF